MAGNRIATVSKHVNHSTNSSSVIVHDFLLTTPHLSTSVTHRGLHSIGKQYAFLVVMLIASVTLIVLLAVTSSASRTPTYVWQHRIHHRTHRQHDPRAGRLCCLILTAPKYLTTRAKAVNATWAPRCDRYFFITELPRKNMTLEQIQISDRLPVAPISNLISGYDHLTLKTTLALLYLYEHHWDEFDWFVKADDDTYLLVEHLKAFLSKQKSSEPVTFGHNYKVRTRVVLVHPLDRSGLSFNSNLI